MGVTKSDREMEKERKTESERDGEFVTLPSLENYLRPLHVYVLQYM